MLDELIQYLAMHPGVMTAIGITAVLAIVGLWYVVSHHLQAIMITLLTAGGIGSGLLVLYRGFRADMKDLMGIGLFLVVVFPIIFWQAIKMLEPMAPEERGRRPTPSRAFFKKKLS
jgi:CHASE2 domain-containing sensor protein